MRSVARCLHAELIRTAGRSRLWTVYVPTAIVAPVVISLLIAVIAERFARIPGQLTVLEVSTSTSAYWLTVITDVNAAVAAADGQSAENRYHALDHVLLAVPRQWTQLVGNWLFYGALAAALAAVATVITLICLPMVANSVYGAVSIADSFGWRLLWTMPLYAFFAAGAGIAAGALLRSALASATLILFWAYVIEEAVGYLPNGAYLQQFMPVFNAMFATGQDIALAPPWGHNVALVYVCMLFSSFFVIAAIKRKR